MEQLHQAFIEAANNYVVHSVDLPVPWLIAYWVLLAGGLILARLNRYNINFLVWLLPAAVFPGVGTIASLIASIVLLVLKKKKGLRVKTFYITRNQLIVPVAAAVIAGLLVNYFPSGDKGLFQETFVIGVVMLVIAVPALWDMRRRDKSVLYFRIAKADVPPCEGAKTLRDNYTYHKPNEEALPDDRTVFLIRNNHFLLARANAVEKSSRAGWTYSQLCNGSTYVYDVFTESRYKELFDAESAVYIGHGTEKITALAWSYSEGNGVVAWNGHTEPKRPEGGFREYDNEAVREVILYRCREPAAVPLAVTLELLAAALLVFTPLGIKLHGGTVKLLFDFLRNIG